ncbi:hypothetical protein BGW36DRAFT_379615 [Talaromyces proteolyticus]|uniref:Zn(2)-C6 fungal-type domain-containing protein n=1 Tax=Talaromyces proteolyticus TaxID=1131652 RepID=A0AAD4KVX6_9EURO|nr:uncharacterized protein BGW36DRAFT_379615 [Talaromyces proteolyticus]KAH8697881.1 hypothetical protein BGW36DRAFT_379615 [Talaromyces proteolyticus]
MAPRRFHKKSRHGCSQCKQNRTKCDEIPPKCGRCQRIGSNCSLAQQSSGLIFIPANLADNHHSPDEDSTANTLSESGPPLDRDRSRDDIPKNENTRNPIASSHGARNYDVDTDDHTNNNNNHIINNTPAIWLSDSSSSGNNYPNNDTPNSALSQPADPADIITDLEQERLRLIAHYTLHTAQAITDFSIEDGDLSVWRDWVLELAFKHDFLLHGLLSLSALHLALLSAQSDAPSRQRDHYTVLAIQHHDRGVALFRPHIYSNLATLDQDAGFAFSCLVALYCFGIQRPSAVPGSSLSTSSNVPDKPIAKIHQALTLIRSSSRVAKRDFEALKRGRWSAAVIPFPEVTAQLSLPDEMEHVIAKLMTHTSKTISISTQQEMYSSVIQNLRINLAIAVRYKRALNRVSYFTVMSPLEYWNMVCIGEPLALAILANFGVILHWMKDSIWIEGWGKETVDAVHQALPLEWHECIAWAVREVER